jgi:hypothetical protein
MKTYIPAILAFIFAISCKSPNSYEVFEKNWADCRQYYDKPATYQKMQGNWKLVGNFCGYCTKPGYKNTKEDITIWILPDSVVKTFQNGRLINTVNFSVTGESYSPKNIFFVTMPYPNGNNYTRGYVEFCKNTLAFRTSYMDGEDYFFEKIQ